MDVCAVPALLLSLESSPLDLPATAAAAAEADAFLALASTSSLADPIPPARLSAALAALGLAPARPLSPVAFPAFLAALEHPRPLPAALADVGAEPRLAALAALLGLPCETASLLLERLN